MIVLVIFFATFALTRLGVAIDMLHHGPTICLDVRSTHVHHLAYGICLLCVVGGYLLFGLFSGGVIRQGGFNPRLPKP